MSEISHFTSYFCRVMGKGTADKTYTRGANIVVIHRKFRK